MPSPPGPPAPAPPHPAPAPNLRIRVPPASTLFLPAAAMITWMEVLKLHLAISVVANLTGLGNTRAVRAARDLTAYLIIAALLRDTLLK